MRHGNNSDCKLGLALSGGGFRSALFHIGVLARLAELDLLRKIDVISSVSAGSIIAAYYYLKVKALLEKPIEDGKEAPGREAYIRLVAEIETDFLAAVQKNMLIRTFVDPGKNARMLAVDYSNTERLAELLEKYFYQPIMQTRATGKKQGPITLKKSPIRPVAGNIDDGTRVPFLIINATSLNTGHLWQFTNVSVGEQRIVKEANSHPVEFLNKFRIEDERLNIEQRKILYNITLGQAVAASNCVPGIFEPLQIRNLYKTDGKSVTVRLVDGGLVDNQGLESLFVEKCTHIICSDASNILKSENQPSTQLLNVALRTNDILMNRIRSESIDELFKYGPGKFAMFDLGNRETRNHIFPADSEKIVRALTQIRTAMDSFTDQEADTLMYYGYHLSLKIMETNGFELTSEPLPATGNWRFLEIHDRFLTNDEQRKKLIFHLEIGSRQMFKVFMFKKAAPYLILLPFPAMVALLVLFIIMKISPMTFWGLLICSVLVFIHSQNHKILKVIDNVSVLRRIRHRILKTLISLRLPEPFSYMISLASWIELTVFDPLFLRYGRIRKASGKLRSRRKSR